MVQKITNYILNFLFPTTNSEKISYEILGNRIHIQTIEHTTSFFRYKDKTIRDSIWALKYKNQRNIAQLFAESMYPHILEDISDKILFSNFNEPTIIPIPITRKRKSERGFNQSECIAKEIIKIDENQTFTLLNNILVKTSNTEHQARSKNKKDREENIKGTFRVKNPELIKNKNIILIDDVITTGSTIKEARKVLLKAGAKDVCGFVVAH